MDIDSYEDGVPSWVDVMTPDPEAATGFYSALFGWDVQAGPPEAGGYRMCSLRGRPVAGISPRSGSMPPAWATYVNVADAEAVVARAQMHGAKVLAEPMDVMDAGRMAILADTDGAVVGLWQAGAHRGAGVVNEPGAFCWNELVTADVAGGLAFYPPVFGWEAATHTPEESGGMPGGYTEFQIGGRSIAGMMQKPPTMPAEVPSFWSVYFAVADADRSLARIEELGGRRLFDPMDIPQGRFAGASDPAGAMFNVIALAG